MSDERSTFDPEIFTMRVTIPGEEGVYEIKHAIPQGVLSQADFWDMPDSVIAQMALHLRAGRKEKLWGICEKDGCGRPCTKNQKTCDPHTWEAEQEAMINASPPFPPAL